MIESRTYSCLNGAADGMGNGEDDGANFVDGGLDFDDAIDNKDDIEGTANVGGDGEGDIDNKIL